MIIPWCVVKPPVQQPANITPGWFAFAYHQAFSAHQQNSKIAASAPAELSGDNGIKPSYHLLVCCCGTILLYLLQPKNGRRRPKQVINHTFRVRLSPPPFDSTHHKDKSATNSIRHLRCTCKTEKMAVVWPGAAEVKWRGTDANKPQVW